MQNGASEHHVSKPVRERHLLDGPDPEVRFGQCRRELAGDAADGSDRARIAVHAEDLESVLEEINEIAPAAAPCVDDALARRDPAAKDLIERRCRSGRTRQRDQSLCRCSVGFEPSGADVWLRRKFAITTIPTPSMIATSATLKIPVRNGP